MLASLVPDPMVRLFARPYLAGGDLESAVDTAARLLESRRMLATLDLLGEEVVRTEQAVQNESVYRGLIETISSDPRFASRSERPTVSLKPSAFSFGDNQEHAFEPIRRLARLAKQSDVRLTVDMEDHRWTDVTLRHAVALYEGGFDVGTVLQTRLHRTLDDVQCIPPGMRIRLVIGIYPEPAHLATTDKPEMKERLLQAADILLERGAHVEFATHDEPVLLQFVRDVAIKGPERCEIQHLLGVPITALQDRIRVGAFGPALSVRLYVPFAVNWSDATAYLRRRMTESPNIVLMALRNLVARDR